MRHYLKIALWLTGAYSLYLLFLAIFFTLPVERSIHLQSLARELVIPLNLAASAWCYVPLLFLASVIFSLYNGLNDYPNGREKKSKAAQKHQAVQANLHFLGTTFFVVLWLTIFLGACRFPLSGEEKNGPLSALTSGVMAGFDAYLIFGILLGLRRARLIAIGPWSEFQNCHTKDFAKIAEEYFDHFLVIAKVGLTRGFPVVIGGVLGLLLFSIVIMAAKILHWFCQGYEK